MFVLTSVAKGPWGARQQRCRLGAGTDGRAAGDTNRSTWFRRAPGEASFHQGVEASHPYPPLEGEGERKNEKKEIPYIEGKTKDIGARLGDTVL